MYISYMKLWHLMLDRKMTKKELREKTHISSASLAKLSKGENVTTEILVRICEELNCGLEDIMELVPGEKPESENKKASDQDAYVAPQSEAK